MLRRAKLLGAHPGAINEALIEALIREYPLAPQRRAEMPEALVAKDAVDEPNVISEITRCSRNISSLQGHW